MQRSLFLPLALLGLLATATSCGDGSSTASADSAAPAAPPATAAPAGDPDPGVATGQGIVPVTAQEVADLLLQQGEALTVIDVRTPAEFAEGHIEGALNLDVEGGQFTAGIAALDPTKEYLVYCRSGRRIAIAAQAMIDAGFVTVYDLGPLDAWAAAGFPVVTG